MEVLIPILGLLLLLWVCSDRKGSAPDSPDSRDLRIARNSDGLYYIYDEENGQTIGSFPDMETAADHLKDLQN